MPCTSTGWPFRMPPHSRSLKRVLASVITPWVPTEKLRFGHAPISPLIAPRISDSGDSFCPLTLLAITETSELHPPSTSMDPPVRRSEHDRTTKALAASVPTPLVSSLKLLLGPLRATWLICT